VSSPPTNSTGDNQHHNFSSGALAGGVVGGLVLGALLCALVFLCLRRRKSQHVPPKSSTREIRHDDVIANHRPDEKHQRAVEVSEVTGWQKHLPQDKDDGAIARTFKMVFDQTQIHVEGFYEAKGASVPSAAVDRLRNVVPDSLPWPVLQTDSAVALLETVLLRWIIHRISCRSSAPESLLPSEFTTVPAKNKWHMEKDANVDGSSAEQQRGE
jgi:hypothetical protein